MEPIAKIKKEMEFNKTMGSLLGVIKTIAGMEFHAFKKKMTTFDRFTEVLESAFTMLRRRRIEHPFVEPLVNSTGIIAVTSDTGLLGGLNMQVIRTAVNEYNKNPGKIVVVGKRGEMYLKGYGIPFITFPGIKEDSRQEQAFQLRDYAADQVLRGGFGKVKVVFPYAESFTTQRIKIAEMIPFRKMENISDKSPIPAKDIIMESTPDGIVEYLVYLWMGQSMFEILGWSRLAELAARYTHLETSSQKLEEANSKLRIKYHKIRHQLIDRTMCELFSARSVFGN
ncbi:MAG: FoF1 ATP synthase subunit gamma [Candidatus Omnitrophota bacterium]|nr:F0F1 ATP synthase subunit gamma [Candidatus Omnitrophota bacterium]